MDSKIWKKNIKKWIGKKIGMEKFEKMENFDKVKILEGIIFVFFLFQNYGQRSKIKTKKFLFILNKH